MIEQNAPGAFSQQLYHNKRRTNNRCISISYGYLRRKSLEKVVFEQSKTKNSV